jgi:hypothetical protein
MREKLIIMMKINFFQIFEFNPSPMSINDIDTNLIIDVNRAFVKIMEVDSKNDLIGKNTTEKEGLNFLKEKDKSFFFSELKKNGIFENYIFSFKTKSGKKLKGVVSGTIIELNKKNYLLTVCQIISSRCLMRFFNLL